MDMKIQRRGFPQLGVKLPPGGNLTDLGNGGRVKEIRHWKQKTIVETRLSPTWGQITPGGNLTDLGNGGRVKAIRNWKKKLDLQYFSFLQET